MSYTVKPQYFLIQRVYVGSRVDNIDVDRTTGNLWIGSHYVLHGETPSILCYRECMLVPMLTT